MLITVRDANLAPVEIVDTHTSLEWTDRWLGVGGWILEIPTDTPAAQALLAPGAGIVVTDGDDVELSGPVLASLAGAAQAADRRVTVNDGHARDTLTIIGTTDMVWLRDRITVPPAGQATDDRTGIGSTILLEYVAANTAGGRRIAGLANPVDPELGATVAHSTRYGVLLDTCREIAELAGIGFRLAQPAATRALRLDIAEPTDRTADVRFGLKLGNIGAASISTSEAKGTVAYMAGQGEGAARTIEILDSGAGRRIERFVDRRDLPTADQLRAAGQLWLDENAGALSVTVDPVTSTGSRYGIDYHLGDLVTVDLNGDVTPQRVAAVTTTVDADGRRRNVTLGAEPTPGADALIRAQTLLTGRVSLVERR
jgi:hypothetical protein